MFTPVCCAEADMIVTSTEKDADEKMSHQDLITELSEQYISNCWKSVTDEQINLRIDIGTEDQWNVWWEEYRKRTHSDFVVYSNRVKHGVATNKRVGYMSIHPWLSGRTRKDFCFEYTIRAIFFC